MTIAWPEPLRRQVQGLVDQFLGQDTGAWIGIGGIEALTRAALTLPRGMSGRVETLGGRPLTQALVWMHGTEPQLWVDPAYGGYREAYADFAVERLGLAGRPDGGSFNIDHVFPKAAAALDGLSHVRMLAIEAPGNQSAGRTLEKAMKQRADAAPNARGMRKATWMSIGKASNFTGWEALPEVLAAGNQALVARLFAHLAARGIVPPAGAVEQRMTAHTLGRIR
jgi:hypothetical protein